MIPELRNYIDSLRKKTFRSAKDVYEVAEELGSTHSRYEAPAEMSIIVYEGVIYAFLTVAYYLLYPLDE